MNKLSDEELRHISDKDIHANVSESQAMAAELLELRPLAKRYADFKTVALMFQHAYVTGDKHEARNAYEFSLAAFIADAELTTANKGNG